MLRLVRLKPYLFFCPVQRKKIHSKNFGLAIGCTFSIFYIGCVVLMALLGESQTVFFFNALFHGIDISSIIRMDVSFLEVLLGIAEMFVLGWLMGVVIANLYNFFLKKA